MSKREARRQAKGFIKILLIKHEQNLDKSIVEILEDMLFEQFLMRKP